MHLKRTVDSHGMREHPHYPFEESPNGYGKVTSQGQSGGNRENKRTPKGMLLCRFGNEAELPSASGGKPKRHKGLQRGGQPNANPFLLSVD